MTAECRQYRWRQRLLAADFYLAVLLLLIAGVLKVRQSGVSELLQSLLEQEILSISQLIFVARWQGWFEIVIALVVLSGWRTLWCARGLAALYLFFAVLIAIAADGYWFEPLDCGCFGTGIPTPAYLLLLRNTLIALPLLFIGPDLASTLLSGRRLPKASN